MNPLDLIPGQWKLIGAAIGGLALLALLGTAAAVIDKHGYDKAAAVYQPKLDLAHQQLGEAETANEANQATIADLLANDKANSALLDAYEAKIAAGGTAADFCDIGGGARAERIAAALDMDDAGERAIDVQVTRLRRKIEVDPREPRFLHTVRGRGYTLKPGT